MPTLAWGSSVIAGLIALSSPVFGQALPAGSPRGLPLLPIPGDLPSGGPGGADGPSAFDLDWYTVDGGGATYLTGGQYTLGATAGQPDAGSMSGGDFELGGGFWFGVITLPCYANCDNSTTPPILNVLDFSCFINKFAAADTYANCDNSTTPPVLNVLDFACFINAFAAGCP
jgi:hypothetical protein